MTVSALITRNDITATASQTVFIYTFRVIEATDMAVYQNGVLLSSGYTVTGVNNTTGGTVVLDVGASAGQIVSLVLAMPLDRTTNYQNSGKFLADDVNEDFDKIYIGAIQNENLNDRSLRLKDVEPPTTGVDMTIPLKADRKGKFLAFDSVTGGPIVGSGAAFFDSAAWSVYDFTGDGSTVAFTLGSNPATENNTQVYIDGVYQQKNGYSVSGTVLTFSVAPPNLSTIEVMVVAILPIGSTLDQPTRADLVSYAPAGTGAVATTVQAKLRESVSVKDFGAVGDGVTDDTAAIQAALDAATSVHFPEGTYLVESAINLPSSSGFKLSGSKRSSTTIKASGLFSGVVFNRAVGSASAYVISDMTIDGNGLATHGIKILQGSYGVLTNLEVKGATSAAVELGGGGADVGSTQITECDFDGENVANYALRLKAEALDSFVHFSNFKNATTACVLIESGGNKFVDARTFGASNPPIGFDIDGTNTELIACRAGNIGNICYKIRRSNVVLSECEARWDVPFGTAYAVDVATALKNLRLSGRSVGGADVKQINFVGSYDRSIIVSWNQVIGSSSTPSTFSPSNLVEDLLVGTFDTTLGGNSSNTTSDNGSYLEAGKLALAVYQETPLTVNRTGNNGRAISIGRSGSTTGFIDTTTGKITFGAIGTIEITSGAGNNVLLGDGAWNGSPIRLGTSRLWVDSTGALRIKTGSNPTSDVDGVVVGTQT